MISSAVIQLVHSQPFFAHVVLNMNRIYTNRVPTVGVGIDGGLNLYINKTFWQKLSLDEQVAVLIHEVMHVIYNHISRGKELSDKFNSKMNVAADIAINQYIQNLPEGALTFEMYKAKIPDLEEKQTMEYYYEKIKDLEGEEETLDDHSFWKNVDPEYAEELVKNVIERAIESVGVGRVPGDVMLAIDKLRASKKNWKQELQRFVSRQAETLLEPSRKIRNRRYGILYPGYKKEPKLRLAIAIDTSGSVDEDALTQFYSEIAKIHKTGVHLTIIECDTQVSANYEYKPNKRIEIHGRGGTLFQPAIDAANDLDIDGLIYFTDGGAFDTPDKPKYNVLWAVVGNGGLPVKWGSKICI